MSASPSEPDEPGPRPLRMGVIGCGPIGQLHARAIAGSSEAMLAAVCDIDPRRAQSAAESFGAAPYDRVAKMLGHDSLDAVTIATPDHLHLEPALLAIAAGCYVFCEKPL